CHARRRLPPRSRRVRRPAGATHAGGGGDNLRRGPALKRAALFAAIVVLAWTAWDTGADPVRFVRGLRWIADFLRRMLPPDLRVLPAALLGAITTLEIALLGTAVAALLALPLGFLSAPNVAAPPVFHPARVSLNSFRGADPRAYGLLF